MEAEAFQFGGPSSAQWIILALVVLVVGVTLVITARRFGASSRKKKKAVGAGWHNFYQIAKTRNLSKNETEILKRLVATYGLSKPALIFTSTHILDSCIQRAVRKLGIQEIKGESKEDMINTYYRLRNKVVRNRGVKGIATTKDIPVGAKLRVGVENYGTFPANVNRNVDEYLGIGVPIHPQGKMVPWSKQKVKCSYWKDDDASYNFDTKVIDVIVENEVHSICLKHTDKIVRVQKRRHPRKSMSLPVIYSRIKIIQEEGKKKAVVDRKDSHWGTILDISVGGCSIETQIPIDKNNYVKTQFDLREEYKIVAFGKVMRIERNPGRKTWIMHIKFTKIDKKHKNEIFAVLYNYQTI
ncbi:MAG: PilZ domain-containing protein [Spirochaetota bacterium]|nr:MAG: PilZ domain-containing protein [Spirochaetota bacterium]